MRRWWCGAVAVAVLVSVAPAPVLADPGDDARARLDSLAVKGRAPKTGYHRSEFGDAWTDDVTVPGGHNGCDTRFLGGL